VFTAYAIITAVTVVANASVAVADLARARFVLANMEEVGVPRSWLVPLGVLKGAGAAGLLLGLLGLRFLGTAAAIGLVVFFVGALVTQCVLASSTTLRSPQPSSRWPPRLRPWRSPSSDAPASITRIMAARPAQVSAHRPRANASERSPLQCVALSRRHERA
jgi:hypothetical protein